MGEEEEDVDEEDEEALGEEEEGDGEIFLFVVTQPRHFVLHIPNTPPHHHLCSRYKARRDRLRQFEKNPKSNARNARPIPIKKRPNIRYKAKKKINPRDGVFSQTIKQKTNPFFPPLKTEISLKKIERKTLCIILFL